MNSSFKTSQLTIYMVEATISNFSAKWILGLKSILQLNWQTYITTSQWRLIIIRTPKHGKSAMICKITVRKQIFNFYHVLWRNSLCHVSHIKLLDKIHQIYTLEKCYRQSTIRGKTFGILRPYREIGMKKNTKTWILLIHIAEKHGFG